MRMLALHIRSQTTDLTHHSFSPPQLSAALSADSSSSGSEDDDYAQEVRGHVNM